MKQIVEFKDTDPQLGLLTRKSRKGPEQELVQNFTGHLLESFWKKNTKLAVFFEPQLDTGFPDIVLVEYSPNIFDAWTESRLALLPIDLKVLYHLYYLGGSDSESLETQLGINSKNLLISLERLLGSKLIKRSTRKWKPYNLKHTFAITKIIAVEAKIKDWKSAFQQAETNKWFSSESYIVSPVSRPTTRIIDTAGRLGVGIYTFDTNGMKEINKAVKGKLPSCYASWMFNEWIGRHLHIQGGSRRTP